MPGLQVKQGLTWVLDSACAAVRAPTWPRCWHRLDLRALCLPTCSSYSLSPFCSYDRFTITLATRDSFLFHYVPVSVYLWFSFPFVCLSMLTHFHVTCAVPCTCTLRLYLYLFISLLSLCLYLDMLLASPSTIQSIPYLYYERTQHVFKTSLVLHQSSVPVHLSFSLCEHQLCFFPLLFTSVHLHL